MYSLRVVAGLRERKKRATRLAIRDAAMALFAQQGFARTTIDQIAEAADVSRATVFSYFPTKEEIVFGDGAAAVDALPRCSPSGPRASRRSPIVRGWLGELTGWIEPELVLQLRLAREVPRVGARRLQLYRRDPERHRRRARGRARPGPAARRSARRRRAGRRPRRRRGDRGRAHGGGRRAASPPRRSTRCSTTPSPSPRPVSPRSAGARIARVHRSGSTTRRACRSSSRSSSRSPT